MSEHFNQLTAAELERLALLSEELGEAQQAIGKILRHGYDSCHPDHLDGPDNREALTRELGDVVCAIDMLRNAGDVQHEGISVAANRKRERVKPYLHHQE